MSIVFDLQDSALAHIFDCSICGIQLVPEKATAGLLDVQGAQAYACVSHLSEVELLIRGWADFITRQKSLQRDQERGLEELYGGKR